MPLLTELIEQSGIEAALHNADGVEVSGITADSRRVRAGDAFVALRGTGVDGTQFIQQAAEAGAAAIVTHADVSRDGLTIPFVQASEPRLALSKLAAAFFGAQPQFVVGITGTDGKTSTAEFYRQLCALAGMQAASLGTLGLRSGDAERDAAFPANNTSAEPVLLQQTLAALKQDSVEHVALEVSSHGLHQYRMDGVRFCAAAFTNLTSDHLDYHKTIDAYFAAKARLFSELLPEGGVAVLNADDKRFGALQAMCNERNIQVMDFGYNAQALRIESVNPTAYGLDVKLAINGAPQHWQLPLFGAFQVQNILAAFGLALASGLSQDILLPQVEKLQGIRGRLEKVATHNGAPVFVDYAHTAAALENVLKQLRAHTQGALHVVFGCGGDRDASKRPLMGKAASDYADHIVVTDDNPRSEDPAAIRAAIMRACPQAENIGDRGEAIAAAVQKLQQEDVLLVAGKGHETTQTLGEQTIEFNDADAINNAIKGLSDE